MTSFVVDLGAVHFDMPLLKPFSTCHLLWRTRAASTAFTENQLSRSLISLSPLFTVHPSSLLRTPVRPSRCYHASFSLTMNRSPRFGSRAWGWTTISADLLSLGFHATTSTLSPHIELASPLYKRYPVTLLMDKFYLVTLLVDLS